MSFISSPIPLLIYCLLIKLKISNFDSSIHNTFFHCSTVNLLYSRDPAIRIQIHAETKSTIMTNEHTSLEKYTPHTLFERVAKGLRVRGELETEQTAIY